MLERTGWLSNVKYNIQTIQDRLRISVAGDTLLPKMYIKCKSQLASVKCSMDHDPIVSGPISVAPDAPSQKIAQTFGISAMEISHHQFATIPTTFIVSESES